MNESFSNSLKRRIFCLILSVVVLLVCSFPVSAAETSPSDKPLEPPPIISCSDAPESGFLRVRLLMPDGQPLSEGDFLAYKMGDDVWRAYVSTITLEKNCVFEAKIIRSDGTESQVAALNIGNIDKTPPTPPTINADTATWVRDSVSVTLVSGTDADSGYVRSEYRLGAEGQWSEYTAPVSVISACTFFARGLDAAGNYSDEVSVVINNFDKTAPNLSDVKVLFSSEEGFVATESTTFSKHFRSNITVTVSGGHDDQSGMGRFEYQQVGNNEALKDDGWQKYDSEKQPVINKDFCGYVFVRAYDKAGNISQPISSEGVILDKTAPVIKDIKRSTENLTDSRVVVTFKVTDNVQINRVTVNGTYVGSESPSFTAYRNGSYRIEAGDIAGNVTTNTITIDNIDSTPFTLVKTFNSLDSENYTPTSWAAAQKAASELQGYLTVDSSDAMIKAASEKLIASMESLVQRGDLTASLRLIDKFNEYDKALYTDSSIARAQSCIDEINALINDPERTQETVDIKRRSLESAITDLTLRGSFDTLDRLIAQCDTLDALKFDKDRFAALQKVLESAKAMPRTDSSQDDIDAKYQQLLDAMGALKEVPEKEGFDFTLLMFVIIGLLIIAIGTALFIINKRMRSGADDEDGEDYYDTDEPETDADDYTDENAEDEPTDADTREPVYIGHRPRSIGDIVFTDDDDDE